MIPPMEIPVRVPRDGVMAEVCFHQLTDEELQWFASQALPDEGWRWARSVARLLAGEPPRPWKARTP